MKIKHSYHNFNCSQFGAFVDGDNANPDHIFKYSDGEYIQETMLHEGGLHLLEGSGQNALYVTSNWQYEKVHLNELKNVLCEVPKGRTLQKLSFRFKSFPKS